MDDGSTQTRIQELLRWRVARRLLGVRLFAGIILHLVITSAGMAGTALPLRGGEHVLFVGNSLTASLNDSLNAMAKANGLPAFNGHRVQIWNQTFETHCTIAQETHARLYYEDGKRGQGGCRVKGASTVLGKGQYDTPAYNEAGWVMTEEVIRKGTPEGEPWDVVVLQGYGGANAPGNRISKDPDGTIHAEGGFMVYGGRLIEAARAAGAQPVLYMAWLLNPEKGGGNEKPDSYYNQNFDRLIAGYRALGEVYDVPIVPVGAAMRALSAESKPPEARTAWLIRDNVHGTACGAALLHYCMAGALFGRLPTDLIYTYTSQTQWDKGRHYVVGEPEERYGLVVTETIDGTIRQAAQDYLTEYGWRPARRGRAGQAADRPNIIWLYADDHAFQALSAYGGRLAGAAPTPNLDRLAASGMRFDRSYVANSICAPARACVLTGQHSHRNGVCTNGDTLDYEKVVTFPQLLQQRGYATALFGKWHLKVQPRGFDEWAVLPGQGNYYSPSFRVGDPDAGDGEGREQVKGGHSTRAIMDKSLAWLDTVRDADRPFLLMCQFKAPHRRWQPDYDLVDMFADTVFPEPPTLHDDYHTRATAAHEQQMTLLRDMSLDRDLKLGSEVPDAVPEERRSFYAFYQARKASYAESQPEGRALTAWKYQAYLQDYLACVRGVDRQVGRLLDYLDANGLANNTIVAYSSDQGFYLGEHGWFDKRFMYEESFRTPLLVAWPGVTEAGTVNTDLVQNIDMAPTFLEIAGVQAPDVMQGASIVPLLQGRRPTDWRDALYYHYYEYPAVHQVRRHEGVFDGRYKLIRFYGRDVPDGEAWELFDLEADPLETVNVYAQPAYGERRETLTARLAALRALYAVSPQGN